MTHTMHTNKISRRGPRPPNERPHPAVHKLKACEVLIKDLQRDANQLREQLAEEREKVEELIKLLAIAQEQQESLSPV
jgi:hypothetical protein